VRTNELIDYTAVRFEDAVSDVDVVVDLAGDAHDDTGTRSLDVLRPGGLLVAVPAGVSPGPAAAAEAKGGRVTPFPLEQAAAAHDRGESHRTRGKLVLRVAPRPPAAAGITAR
jgi:NADPH:quinone reductase-like Zn-dependent oxidoreductase